MTAARYCFPPAQLQVIALTAQGLTNCEIATRLGVKPRTVKTRVGLALAASGARDRAGLVALACRAGQLQDVPQQVAGPVVLSRRSLEVLAGIAAGLPNPLIAEGLWLSEDGVRSRVRRLLKVLGARDRAHAVLIAWQLRILPEAGGTGRTGRAHPVAGLPAASGGLQGRFRSPAGSEPSAGRYGAHSASGVVKR